MKQLSIIIAFLCSLVLLFDFASSAKFVSYPITRALPENGLARFRRADTVEVLTNNLSSYGYYASVQVGTPSQTLSLLLGTGSSDVWVIDTSAPTCSSTHCATPFNPNASQTISTVAPGGFNISYVDGTHATGDYIKDTFAVGQVGQARMVLQMGLATDISASLAVTGGIMGIGYDNNEATTKLYPNFMDQMVDDGLTNTKLYSLWLNDVDSSTGSILFGAIDTEKYYGTLYSMNIHPDSNGNYSTFTVGLTSLSLTPGAGSTIALTNASFATPVVLESSTTLIYLPGEVVDTIYSTFGVYFDTNTTTAYVDCKYSNSSYMSFGFESGSIVNVAYSEIINKLAVPSTVPSYVPFSDPCAMGILNGDSSALLLGDFFLRSAYVVYDLTNNRIGIAQSNLNSTASNIVEVPAGAASIPQSTGVALPNPSTTRATTTIAPTTTATNAPTTPTNSPTNTSAPSSNHAVAIGVGVAVPVGVILAAIISFLLWRRRRKASQTTTTTAPFAENNNTPYSPGQEKNNTLYPTSDNGGMSPRSQFSELASVSATSPRNTVSGFERNSVQQGPAELPAVHEGAVYSGQEGYEGPERPTSNVSELNAGEGQSPRPISNITGPLNDMPAR